MAVLGPICLNSCRLSALAMPRWNNDRFGRRVALFAADVVLDVEVYIRGVNHALRRMW